MAKILILASTGFGKTTSLGKIDKYGILGLNSEETYIISATSKPLPFKGSETLYPITTANDLKSGKRVVSNQGNVVAHVIEQLADSPYKNIVLDDSNYIMQDYYMANAKKKGYDVFKEIGAMMDMVFSAAELIPSSKHFIMMAHFEEYKDSSDDTLSYRYKTVGKMVNDYITPEGKFDVVLYGKQIFDTQTKAVSKRFVTNYDGQFPAKSPVDMFEDVYIPNDLGYVIKKIEDYYK